MDSNIIEQIKIHSPKKGDIIVFTLDLSHIDDEMEKEKVLHDAAGIIGMELDGFCPDVKILTVSKDHVTNIEVIRKDEEP